jgi:redox-sensitive bicupin YhaK (pirin superfamily)
MLKSVKYLLPAEDINMGGIIVKQALPTQKVDQLDPFLLLHHGTFSTTEDAPARQQGIGPHPHRGFSPVTFVIRGEVHHRDSRGNDQIAKEGEVQWMFAGAGIVHSERPSEALANVSGTQEIVQLWINAPAASKMKQPKYQYKSKAEIPVFTSEDGQFVNKLVAGNYGDLRSNMQTESELLIVWSQSKSAGSQSYTIPTGFNTMIYVIKGNLHIKGYGKVSPENLVIFEAQDGDIEVSAEEKVEFLLLCGKPIDEVVVKQGPFVMNNTTEIMVAMRDYQMGKMGILIEE